MYPESVDEAVQDEEQSSTLRKTLWGQVDDQMMKVFASKNYSAVERTRSVREVRAIIGFVRWIMDLSTKGPYKTESRSCWQLSMIFSCLGFEVTASPIILNTIESCHQARSEEVLYVTVAD